MKRTSFVIILSLLMSSCNKDNAGPAEEGADLVVYGTMFTADDATNSPDAFAVKDGKFIFVGSKTEALKYVDPNRTEIVNYEGKGLIIPGCTEGHGHFIGIDGVMRMMPGFGASFKELTGSIIKQHKERGKFRLTCKVPCLSYPKIL